MKDFKDKVAVVTGAASGIGRAIADRCAKEGMNIVIADIEEDPLNTAKEELQATGASVTAIKTDVSKAEDVETLAKETIETFGEVHLLFNNAGVGTTSTIWECSLDQWRWVLGVNLWGVIHGVRVFTPLMLKQNTECHIVNTASIAGLDYNTYMGPYGVSKYGVVTLSESLHLELADIDSKIKVSVLCPGIVKTRIIESPRNRPPWYVESSDIVSSEALSKLQVLEDAMSGQDSLTSEEVADKTFKAIREERFYVITHRSTFADIETRMNNILQERNPTLT
jgi:NAD(P)-dependent dehydrogenase (short-subunit alcohol dehydrogenase family)